MAQNFFNIQIDTNAFVEQAKRMDGALQQLPFALSTMLNDAAFATRRVLTESTWPKHVNVRNKNFLSASLRVEKASKYRLRVEIYDILERGKLYYHAKGGLVRPFSSRVFAIPVPGHVRRGARGVSARDKPRNLPNNKRSVRVTKRGIFVGKGGRLHMIYSFKPAISQPKDVPFFEDFHYAMKAHCRTSFGQHLARAMATRKTAPK